MSNSASQPSQHQSSSKNWFLSWLLVQSANHGTNSLSLIAEQGGMRASAMADFRETVKSHFEDPQITASRLAKLGAPKTAAILRKKLPLTKKARSGDVGEVLATETAERLLQFNVPIRRLRWKDGRNMSLRGDDLIGISRSNTSKLKFLKGESKSRAALSPGVITKAADALTGNKGRPTPHSVIFVADRLREEGQDSLATDMEDAVLASFKGYDVEHLLFVLSGNKPDQLLSQSLASYKGKIRRHAIGIHISDHGNFIADIFRGF